jgi:hypothetical protein
LLRFDPRGPIEFLGLWETLNNPDFKPIEFERFKTEAGSNYFVLSPQRWIAATNAIGITSKSGRYGGTFAHKDIAFGCWVGCWDAGVGPKAPVKAGRE